MAGKIRQLRAVPRGWRRVAVRDALRRRWEPWWKSRAQLYNIVGTHVPSRRLRRAWLRALGAQIAPDAAIFRGVVIHYPDRIVVRERASIGAGVVLNGAGGIDVGPNTIVGQGSMLLSGDHDPMAPDFAPRKGPIVIGRDAWLTARSIVLKNVRIGDRAVVGAGAVVFKDVPAGEIVAGNPARRSGMTRPADLSYDAGWLPPLH